MPLVVNVLSLLASFVIIPGLGEVGWGAWSTALGLSGAVIFMTGLGIRPLFVRGLSRTNDLSERRRLVGSQLLLRQLLALVASAIALAIGFALGYSSTIMICAAIAAAGLIPTVMWTTYVDVLNADEEFRASAVANLVSGSVLTAATVVVVLLGWGPVGVAFAYLVGPVLTAAQLGARVHRRGLPVLPRWDPVEVRRQVREAKLTAAGDAVGNLLTRLHGIYVPAIVGPVSYGFFATGTLLTTRLQVVADALITAYTPGVSRDHEMLRQGRATWSSRTMMRLLLAAGVLLGVGALAAAAWFTGLVYRDPAAIEARQSAMLAMAIVSASLPFVVLAMGWRQLLIASDHHDLAARVGAKAAAIGAVIAVSLTWRLGIAGAAVGIVLAGAVSGAMLGTAARRVIGAAASVPAWGWGVAIHLGGAGVAALAVRSGQSAQGALLMLAAPLATVALFFALKVFSLDDLGKLRRGGVSNRTGP
jgi:O-antigen/teichoic acid export membrane protein